MQSFVKAAEIWQPDLQGMTLRLSAGHYGHLSDFETQSRNMVFAIGEGLPGETWAQGRPQIWTDLDSGAFKRSEAARAAGIVCGLSLPIYAGEFLLAVVVLFCGGGEGVAGALEVWGNRPDNVNELKLIDGYYGDLERFEWVSRRLAIMRGRGLPGCAWEAGLPLIIGDLGQSNTFLRARNAAESGIRVGLALPFTHPPSDDAQIVTFLSAQGTPIARRFEIWVPDEEHRKLVFQAGQCASGTPLESQYSGVQVAKGYGPMGEAWLTGKPLITRSQALAGEAAAPMMVLPMIRACRLEAVVVFVL